jgi:hypothetical protein
MCDYVDELAASSTTLHNDELVAYLLAGHNEDYNPIFSVVIARADPIKPPELYALLRVAQKPVGGFLTCRILCYGRLSWAPLS